MIKTHKYKILAALGFLVSLWFAWPVYGFYAHRDVVPLSPFGWLQVPEEAPSAQNLSDPAYAKAGNEALKILEKHRTRMGAPSLSAAVAVRGKVVWAGATGWADIKSGTAASPKTIFRIGSTSKALTATALARLVDAGLIDLDAPISTYVDNLPNSDWAPITPRQLASHMAGLPHYRENGDWIGLYKTIALRSHYVSMHEALEIFDGSPLLYRPGEDFFYSSLGTVLLGAVISAAADKPFLEVMEEQVFGPNDMSSTIVAPAQSRGSGDIATFYKRRNGKVRPWRDVDLSHRLPAGGFASTPTDLVKMGIAMLDDRYISASTREAFWTQQTLANGSVNEQGYAIGWRTREWEIDGVGLVRNANHGGVSRGAQSWLLVFPDHEMALAFNINSKTDEFREFGWATYQDLARLFIQAQSLIARQ